MMCDFKQSTDGVGLKIHPDKTKIPSNQSSNRRKELEFSLRARVRNILDKQLRFSNRKQQRSKNRIRAAWALFYRHKQELKSKSYFLQHRLRLFNMVITPTLSYASGTWTLSREHERMIRSTQRKMLRLIVQTQRKYKKKTQTSKNEKDGQDAKVNHRSSDHETAEGSSSNTDCDQDSDVSFMEDTDEEIDTGEIEEEEWIEYMKRSTATPIEWMKASKIPSWIEKHRMMKWRLAKRIASLPDERWVKKAAEWNPGLSIKHQTYRPVGRPKKRCEDGINEFLKPEETEVMKDNETKNNDTWIKVAKIEKDGRQWKVNSQRQKPQHLLTVHSRRCPPQDRIGPARDLSGVNLDDYQVVNIA